MNRKEEVLQDVVIKFAGDSGDGMQLTGSQFTNNTALLGIDLATFPDFPAEIRAPQGTLPGVSGYQLRFSSDKVYTPGDECDVLVAMNAAALKSNLRALKKGGKIIVNLEGFDSKNLRLANYPEGINPLEDNSLDNYTVIKIDVTKMTREALKEFTMGTKEKDRAKNMFVLGFLYWMYNRNMESTLKFLKDKFGKKPEIFESNAKVLQAGYHFGDTTEEFTTTYRVEKAKMDPGVYRSIMGNQALAYGLIAASRKSGLPLFLGSYPITPASDILHELSRQGLRRPNLPGGRRDRGDHLSHRRRLRRRPGRHHDLRARPGIESRGHGTRRYAGDPITDLRYPARRPLYRTAYQDGTKRSAASLLRPQRRMPHAGGRRFHPKRLLRGSL